MSTRKNNAKSLHSQRMREIRRFVNFNYDLRKELTPYQKKKIKKYHDEFRALTARPFHPYRSKSKDRLTKAREFAGQDTSLTGFKAALIPTTGDEKPKVVFTRKGELRVKTKHVTSRSFKFDKHKLAADPVKHVNDVIAGSDASHFTIMAGPHEIPNPATKSMIAKEVAHYVAAYGDKGGGHYFGDWLVGVRGHTFRDQRGVFDYMRSKQGAEDKRRAERQKIRMRKYRAKIREENRKIKERVEREVVRELARREIKKHAKKK